MDFSLWVKTKKNSWILSAPQNSYRTMIKKERMKQKIDYKSFASEARRWDLFRNKKALYFTLEAIIALMVLSIGFTILVYLYMALAEPPVRSVQTDLYDLLEVLDQQILDLGEGTCSAQSSLVEEGIINDTTNSFLTQLGEFYYRMTDPSCDCEEEYQTYIENCITDFLEYQNLNDRNLHIKIENAVLYSSDEEDGRLDQANATVLFPFRVLLVGIYDKREPWGYYVSEVRLWE